MLTTSEKKARRPKNRQMPFSLLTKFRHFVAVPLSIPNTRMPPFLFSVRDLWFSATQFRTNHLLSKIGKPTHFHAGVI